MLLVVLGAATQALAVERVANDAESLRAAIANAQSGDDIVLESADFGVVEVRNRKFSPPLTIRSASKRAPARFASIVMLNANGVYISDIDIAFGVAASPLTTYAIDIRASVGVALENVSLSSAVNAIDNDDSNGVIIRKSTRVSIRNSRIHDVFRGVVIFDSTDSEVRQTRFYSIGSDGVALRGSQRISILDNLFTGFKVVDPVRFHPDAIQIWSRHATQASEDIVIRGNVIRRGAGDPTQGIFVKTLELPTRRLIIEENIVEQSMGQGVYVQGASEVTIRNNTVIPFDPLVDRPGIDVRDPISQTRVIDNITVAARLQAGIDVRGNDIAGIHNAKLGEFLRTRLKGGASRSAADDYLPLSEAGARQFNRELWVEDVSRAPATLFP